MWLAMKQRNLAQQGARGKKHNPKLKTLDSAMRGRMRESASTSTSTANSGSSRSSREGSSSDHSRSSCTATTTTSRSRDTASTSERSKTTSAGTKEHAPDLEGDGEFDDLEEVPDERDCGAPRDAPAVPHLVRAATSGSAPRGRGGSSRVESPVTPLLDNSRASSSIARGHEAHGLRHSTSSGSSHHRSSSRSESIQRTAAPSLNPLFAAAVKEEAAADMFDGNPHDLLMEYYQWRQNRGLPVGSHLSVRKGAPHSY